MAAHQPPDVPATLWRAIVNAGRKYNVPPLVLAAVWRGESGSTYPNPYVNSEGYGGLFGTKEWNASTQQQANYAASIFHNALVTTRGNILEANGIYATGKPTPGLYGHAGLPTGTVGGYGSGASNVNVSSSGSNAVNADGTFGTHHRTKAQVKKILSELLSGTITKQQAAKRIGVPAKDLNTGGGTLNSIGGAITDANSFFQSLAEGAFSSSSPQSEGLNAAGIPNPLPQIKDATSALKWLFSVNGIEVIGGGLIMILGLYLLALKVGLDVLPGPAVVTNAAKNIQSSGQSRATEGALKNAYNSGQADAIGDAQPKPSPAPDFGGVPF